jgi:hypothetical protein
VTDAEAVEDERGVYNTNTHICLVGTGENLGYSQLIAISSDVICSDGTNSAATHYCSWATSCTGAENPANPNCDATLGYVRTTGTLKPLYTCLSATNGTSNAARPDLYNPDKEFCWHPGRATAGIYKRGASNICNGKLAPPSDLGATFDYADEDNWGSTGKASVPAILADDGGTCYYLGYDLGPSRSCNDQKRQYSYFGENGCTGATATCNGGVNGDAGNETAGLFTVATQFCVLQTGVKAPNTVDNYRHSVATVFDRAAYQWCQPENLETVPGATNSLKQLYNDTLTSANPGMTAAQKAAAVLAATTYVTDAYLKGATEAVTLYFCKSTGYAALKEACDAQTFNWEKQFCEGNVGTRQVLNRCGYDNTGSKTAGGTEGELATQYPPALAVGGLTANSNPGYYSTETSFCFSDPTDAVYSITGALNTAGTYKISYPIARCNGQVYTNQQACARPASSATNIGSSLDDAGKGRIIPNVTNTATSVVPNATTKQCGYNVTVGTAPYGASLETWVFKGREVFPSDGVAVWSCNEPAAVITCPGTPSGSAGQWPTDAAVWAPLFSICALNTTGSIGTSCETGTTPKPIGSVAEGFGKCMTDLDCTGAGAVGEYPSNMTFTPASWSCTGAVASNCDGGTGGDGAKPIMILDANDKCQLSPTPCVNTGKGGNGQEYLLTVVDGFCSNTEKTCLPGHSDSGSACAAD